MLKKLRKDTCNDSLAFAVAIDALQSFDVREVQ